MKKTTLALVLSVFAASSIFPTLSYADGPGHHGKPPHHDNGHHRGPAHGPAHHAPIHHGKPHPHRVYRDHFSWQGHDFRRGRPLPAHFRGHGYRVDDWRRHGLYEPPRGSYWSYIDGKYVLVAAATGIIGAIILNNVLN